MILPIYDIAYIFNCYQMFATKAEVLQPIIRSANEKLRELSASDEHYYDKCSTLVFIKGMCYKQLGDTDKAISLFEEVVHMDGDVIENKHLAPQACFEVGHMHCKADANEAAKDWLQRAKRYTKYSTEIMIAYRAKIVLDKLNKKS